LDQPRKHRKPDMFRAKFADLPYKTKKADETLSRDKEIKKG
jgi:hypothetical protein